MRQFALALILGPVQAFVAPAALAQSVTRTLDLDALLVLSAATGLEPTAPSPFAGLIGRRPPSEGAPEAPADEARSDPEAAQRASALVEAAGLLDGLGRPTAAGRALWAALARPSVAWQVRGYDAGTLRAAWVVASDEVCFRVAFGADLDVELVGPEPRARLVELIADTLLLPQSTATAGIDLDLPLVEYVALQTVARERATFTAILGSDEPATGLTNEEVATYLLTPDRLAVLVADPQLDPRVLWDLFVDAGALAPVLDRLTARGLVARAPSREGPRYALSDAGAALDAALRPAALVSFACLVARDDGVPSAASLSIGLSGGRAVAVRTDTARGRVALTSFPVGATHETLRRLLAALAEDAANAPESTSGLTSDAASGDSLGATIGAELVRGASRLAAATSTDELWGRGRVDTWRIDLGGDGRPDIEYEDSTGDGAPDHVRVRDMPSGPFNRAFARDARGQWVETNVLGAFIELTFGLPWDRAAYHPHDLDVLLNDRLVARLEDVLPEGRYRFRVRPQDLRIDARAASANEVRVETRHLRGGHYVVATDLRLVIQMTEVSGYVIADSPEEAQRLLARRGHLATDGVDLALYANEWSLQPAAPRAGQSVVVAGRVHNDGEELARGGTLALFVGAPTGDAVATLPLPPIEKGASVRVDLRWEANASDTKLTLVVTTPEGVMDRRTKNDRLDLTVAVQR